MPALPDLVGAVVPTTSAIAALTPLSARDVSITGGFWAERLRINRERTLPHGYAQLERAGNFHNLRLAAGAAGRYESLGVMFESPFPFLDSDVYKWLEAVAWELGRAPDAVLAGKADEAIALVAAAQRPDGYLNSFVQVLRPGGEFQDLAWGHELYCIGHLIQAAVAWQRALGDGRLLEVAVRAVQCYERAQAASGQTFLEGHPQIEMALVELYRVSGERRYLEAAARMIQSRGHGRVGPGRFGAAYWQDHAPVRRASTVAGHAVRQLYLDCGAVDVATELGDEELLNAVKRRWADMVATRTYLTGGLGSRPRDESFGDPFELPPDSAYAETCAAIASAMLARRLLLATGDSKYADLIERTVYNGMLAGVSSDGTRFFYDNPLQRRTDRLVADAGHGERAPWFACACCPPNLMRTLSSWPQQLATSNSEGLQVHQYATSTIAAGVGGGNTSLETRTDYPWDSRVTVTVTEATGRPWTLSLRIPAWCHAATVTSDGQRRPVPPGEDWVRETRAWRPGDSIVLDFEMTTRLVEPDPRIDAIRGCVAIERGPLVYCLESADLPGGVTLEEIELETRAEASTKPGPAVGASVVGLRLAASRRSPEAVHWPYRETHARPAGGTQQSQRGALDVLAIPYFSWANRTSGGMRVWIPTGRPLLAGPRAHPGARSPRRLAGARHSPDTGVVRSP